MTDSMDDLGREALQHEASEAEGIDRRSMLRLMGASLALATAAGCGGPEPDQSKWVAYIKEPPGIVSGRERHFATATLLGGYGTGVLVTHYMGRPIKVEGNPDHPASLGATSHWAQAEILSLYDPERSQSIIASGRVGTQQNLTAALAASRDRLTPKKGAGLRILTGTITSPSLIAQIADLMERFPDARWHCWEAAGRDEVAAGAQLAFGRSADCVYKPNAADVILGIGSDLISCAPGHLRYARALAERRRAAEVGAKMSRIYAVESTPTLFGALADHRRRARPDEVASLVRSLAMALGAAPVDAGPPPDSWLVSVVEDLRQHKGAALVHIGAEQPAEQHALGHAINAALQAPGRTLTLIDPVAGASQSAGTLGELVADMRRGEVDTLLILGVNPMFDAPADLGFRDALARVPHAIHLGPHVDETAVACSWHVPEAHVFESWGDCRAFDGTTTIVQPQAQPFYGGITAQELLARWDGAIAPSGMQLLRAYWRAARPEGDFEAFWTDALRKGVVPDTAEKPIDLSVSPSLSSSLSPLPAAAPQGSIDVLFRPDEGLWDGRFANNGWLQEMPRWHSKRVWDNAAQIAPDTAARLGLDMGDMVEIGAGDRAIRMPVWILPGQAPDCVTLPLGFGRQVVGNVGERVGFDAYPLRTSDALWRRAGVRIVKRPGRHIFADSQHANRMEGRDIVRGGLLAEFLNDPRFLDTEKKPRHVEPDDTLYPPFKYEGDAWAMAINLNSCIGCEACVVACEAENNTPVVGKDQVLAGRLMHWLRIDRYYSGPAADPKTDFQPVPCMHCENAPCEVVCPVQATLHDSDGLNLMVYNRCVGTRFCSNNCPYKVRRFNFFAYAHRDPRLPEAWNPDVTVRGRGVMEKCTYCVQRIREAKIVADREDRPVRDGEVVTACQAACPTQAIVFGNQNDRQSAVFKRKASPLDYALLEELNTRPRTTYEARIRNPNSDIGEG